MLSMNSDVCAVLPLAADPQLAENSPPGFATLETSVHPGFAVCNSTTALGMRGTLALEAIRKYESARYYDPNVGRFAQEDLLRLPDGKSRYDYVLNSPLTLFDPLGLCPWEVRTRPLKRVPKSLADIPRERFNADADPSHMYFYNNQTGQAIGLGPKEPAMISNVPGTWETHEKPAQTIGDNYFGSVSEGLCDCVDNVARNPGKAPNYCGLGKPHLWQVWEQPCTNCWNWVLKVLKDCKEKEARDHH